MFEGKATKSNVVILNSMNFKTSAILLWPSCMSFADYMPKCLMNLGPYGPILFYLLDCVENQTLNCKISGDYQIQTSRSVGHLRLGWTFEPSRANGHFRLLQCYTDQNFKVRRLEKK